MRLAAERGRRIDRALDEAVTELDARERAFAHELAYGVTRLRGRLDHLIALHVHRGLESVDPLVLEVLRSGAYQLLYMDSVPTYAAVSTSVDLVRDRAGARPTGLVNAVLKRIAERGEDRTAFPGPDDPATFLSSWGSHPQWLVERWLARWSPEEVSALVEANNRRPDLCVVDLVGSPDEAARRFGEAGIEAEPVGGGSTCLRLARGTSPSEALRVVPGAVVQDPGANLVVLYSDVPAGTIVADLCAAPGGKALAAAGRARFTLASDRSESRLRMLRDNARRVGRSVALAVADARAAPLERADVVLLDVPCTGTGTLARHPDARWRLRPESIETMTRVQAEIIEAAATRVSPGGLLVYSTCTLEPEENEGVVDAFLQRHREFTLDPSETVPGRYLDGRGMLTVAPHETGFDGAFAARMRRAA